MVRCKVSVPKSEVLSLIERVQKDGGIVRSVGVDAAGGEVILSLTDELYQQLKSEGYNITPHKYKSQVLIYRDFERDRTIVQIGKVGEVLERMEGDLPHTITNTMGRFLQVAHKLLKDYHFCVEEPAQIEQKNDDYHTIMVHFGEREDYFYEENL